MHDYLYVNTPRKSVLNELQKQTILLKTQLQESDNVGHPPTITF